MTTYSIDAFTRADAATVGLTSGSGTLDPLTWQTRLGTCGIISLQARASALGSLIGMATLPITHADVNVSLTVATSVASPGFCGIVFRFVDVGNYWVWQGNTTKSQLMKKTTAGGAGLVQVGSDQAAFSNGDVLNVSTLGSSIWVSKNGSLLINTSDVDLVTGTSHGFYTTDVLARFDDFSASLGRVAVALSDTVGITDTKTSLLGFSRSFSNAVGITDKVSVGFFVRDTVGITDGPVTVRHSLRSTSDAVGVTNTITAIRSLVPYDTWRPVLRPDNVLVLACRTPVGEHDTYTGLTHLNLWTFLNDGSMEKPEVGMTKGVPVSSSWVSFSHPEWSPDGQSVVVASETSSNWHLSVLDASGFGP